MNKNKTFNLLNVKRHKKNKPTQTINRSGVEGVVLLYACDDCIKKTHAKPNGIWLH